MGFPEFLEYYMAEYNEEGRKQREEYLEALMNFIGVGEELDEKTTTKKGLEKVV